MDGTAGKSHSSRIQRAFFPNSEQDEERMDGTAGKSHSSRFKRTLLPHWRGTRRNNIFTGLSSVLKSSLSLPQIVKPTKARLSEQPEVPFKEDFSVRRKFDEGRRKAEESLRKAEERLRKIEESRRKVEQREKAEARLFLMRDGLGLTDSPKNEEWERAKEIHLMHNELSELPENPRCPFLSTLFLKNNYKLKKIPPAFFENMPALQVLNLSETSIRSLPESLFKLAGLKRFFLNNCKNFMMLSPKIGELKRLEVLDLEGTEILDLPEEIKRLTNIFCLEVSLYGYASHGRKTNQSDALIPCGAISSLSRLEELNINVNPDDDFWDINVEAIVCEICSLRRLNTLKFYFPRVQLLRHFKWISSSSEYQSLSRFKFIVGHHVKCIISRLPQDVELELERWDRCLKYVNGEGVPGEIKKLLRYATAFHLDRHTSVKKLSEFGIDNMVQLRCCLLAECNEIRVIIDGKDFHEEDDNREIVSESSIDQGIGLESLEYLYIYYMKNLSRIWDGQVKRRSFSLLKVLTLRTCPQLTTIFTLGVLNNLYSLEELTVEDCFAVKSIVSHESYEPFHSKLGYFLPKLKKISLHYLPKLVSISNGQRIAPELEWMSFYHCPNLKILSSEEVSSTLIKRIKGEVDWWEALEWTSGRPNSLEAVFFALPKLTQD